MRKGCGTWLVGIKAQHCTTVLFTDNYSEMNGYRGFTKEVLFFFLRVIIPILRKYSKVARVKAKENKGGFEDPCLRFFKKCIIFWITKTVIMWACWTLDCVFHPFNEKDHFTKRGLLPTGWKKSLYLIFRCNQLSTSSRSVFPYSKQTPFSFYNFVSVKFIVLYCILK